MLGNFGTSVYKSINDFTNHKDYLNYMYGDIKGFVARCVIHSGNGGKNGFEQRLWSKERLIYKNRYKNIKNVYTSMNSFYNPNGRTVEHLKNLNALYVDIDCYKIGLTPEQVLNELENDYFGRSLPLPTFVINSGRGLYLIWKICEDRNALPRWTSVQHYLCEVCKPFNSDSQCLDAARILRVPFSVNENNGAAVSIMRYCDIKYSLHEIIKEHDVKPYYIPAANAKKVFPFGEATYRQRIYANYIAEQKGIDLPDFKSFDDTFNFIRDNGRSENSKDIMLFFGSDYKPLLEGRTRDLKRLFGMRRGKDCRREYGLFLYRLWLCEMTHDYDYALNETLVLNASLDAPLDENYVIRRTASAEKITRKGNTYKYSKKKIIEVLAITDEEMKELNYLCDTPQSEKERKKKSNRSLYLKKLEKEGKTEKCDTVKLRRECIIAMIAENKSKQEICAELKISVRTYERDRAAIDGRNKTKLNIKNKIEAIKTVAEEKIKGVAGKVISAVKQAVNPAVSMLATKIQPPNYMRTSKACSALLLDGDFALDSLGDVRISVVLECDIESEADTS